MSDFYVARFFSIPDKRRALAYGVGMTWFATAATAGALAIKYLIETYPSTVALFPFYTLAWFILFFLGRYLISKAFQFMGY